METVLLYWLLSLSHDKQTLLGGSQDETINCWDLTTGKCWTTLQAARLYETRWLMQR
ncbi:MAG: hypothetical protein HWQ43_20135 [Nostoc sp. JL31]|uniref:hypothetical protein n=1 Tax=Nostoc sp. JL31 TaxID=2815395 RepID=UPI0025E10694|nr:hypothetical protein [Nostoc sp. JL31]MBN3891363.1 hypothetical protein [Nostoc sp. JL31]